jgi:hypothetical protein
MNNVARTGMVSAGRTYGGLPWKSVFWSCKSIDTFLIRPTVWITYRWFWQGNKIIIARKLADGSPVSPP